jgi:transcription-repair coupling factor (superfamily II helicase)
MTGMSDKELTRMILRLFSRSLQFKQLTEELKASMQKRASRTDQTGPHKGTWPSVTGLAGSSVAFLTAALSKVWSGNIAVITPELEEAENLYDDLSALIGEEKVFYFPSRQVTPYEFHSPSGEITGLRLSSLSALLSDHPAIVVLPARAALEPVIARETFGRQSLQLQVGEELPPETLARRLSEIGFTRVSSVEEVGDFAVRGGLIDFFSPSAELPIRAEFFGDEIESLRLFDVSNQRTVRRIQRIDLLPRREVPVIPETIEEFLEQLDPNDANLIRARFVNDPELPGLEWMAPLFAIEQGAFTDYLAESDLVLFDGGKALREVMDDVVDNAGEHYDRARKRFVNPPPLESCVYDPETVFGALTEYPHAMIEPFRSTRKAQFDFGCSEHPAINSRLDFLADRTREYRTRGYAAVITCDNPGQADRLVDIFSGRDIDIPVEVFHIHAGFVSDTLGAALLSDHQIFSRQFRRIKRRRFKEGVSISSYTNLNPGDIVVHADYGLARFARLETITVDDRSRDCLLLVYADGDKLFVPIEEFNRVSKFAGKDRPPKLTKLGGPSWDRLKEKTRRAVEDMAAELIKLYAARKTRPGHKFGADTVWQRQMEAEFSYEETPDQLKAIEDVKRDMEGISPADRLICGDVGYGKTEVAVRAAFKAVENGKQVALLVPTTILAQQHFSTFSLRVANYPMRIEMLSRFKTRKEQKVIVEKLAKGEVDIIIGTHRLLSKDVSFKELGLLIVDEEQRFGVRHKEKLRQIRENVDTFTLTATPIPRTLQLSLMGARDMSLIATSPRDRLPIQTEIAEFDPAVIRESILREVDRGGQVFFVHNRVQSIEAIYRYLEKVVPQVEVAIAHGQMHERELEGVMLAFLAGRFQVLLCTSIIESGLDIPNVNTIIINRADKFGLAQLYQLRGRVGRSARRAYAYLLTPQYRLMTEDARKRLRAIEAHSDLGSGFALAMRDLEIRGAGNVLGARQSGFIEEIGFDLYTRILEEAVAELKGEPVRRLPETKLEGNLELHLPDDYVSINQQKVDIYRRLSDCQSLDEIEKLREEVEDRFGRMPGAGRLLFDAAGLRVAAAITGAAKLRVLDGRMIVEYPPSARFTRSDIEAMRQAFEVPIEFSMMRGLQLTVDLSSIKESERIPYMKKALDKIGSGASRSQVGV